MDDKSKRIRFPFPLICAVVLVALVWIPFTAQAATHNVANFSELQTALSQVATSDTIYITASFDITDTLTMPQKNFTIQSSGGPFTLSRGTNHDGDMIQVPDKAILILRSITIDGGSRPVYGNALICSGESGTLYLGAGVTITNNIKQNSYGGGLVVWDGGTCYMYDGAIISGNTATNNAGGGIYIQGGTLYMHGGTITGNTAFTGGGVSVSGSTYPTLLEGVFTMYAGTISGNIAPRGGVSVGNDSRFRMGSYGVITGNGDYGVYWEDGSISLMGYIQIGTSLSDNSLMRAGTTAGQILDINYLGLGDGAFINVEPLTSDTAGTVIAEKEVNNFTAVENGYFHYLGLYPTVINPANQRQIILGALTAASVSPAAAVFDKNTASAGYADVSTTLTPGSHTLNSITLGGNPLTAGTHYTVSGNVYTFKKEYLATLGIGAQVFTFEMSGGANPTFTVTVSDSTSAPNASATVGNVTIRGMVGSALDGGQTATITLTGDTVASALVNADASGWFTGLPAGITVTANAPAGSSIIILTFGGTPTVASFQQFIITIPGNVLAGDNPITVDANPSARFKIMGIPKPSSPLPTTMTGDGFPLGALLAVMGIALIAMGLLGLRLRKGKSQA